MSDALILHFFHISESGRLPITRYKSLYEQAINIGSFEATGKLELQTPTDKEKQMREELAELKERGLIGR